MGFAHCNHAGEDRESDIIGPVCEGLTRALGLHMGRGEAESKMYTSSDSPDQRVRCPAAWALGSSLEIRKMLPGWLRVSSPEDDPSDWLLLQFQTSVRDGDSEERPSSSGLSLGLGKPTTGDFQVPFWPPGTEHWQLTTWIVTTL